MTLRYSLFLQIAIVLMVAPSALQAQTVTTFDVPDAAGTFPQSINSSGQVTGYYLDEVTFQPHGFFRDGNGILITFDVVDSIYTMPQGISTEGQITGTYQDAASNVHGFLRQPDGSIISFDGMGARATYARAISPGGLITGYYSDGSGDHGFLRKKNGTIISFDVPGTFLLTYPQAINRKGQITGWNVDQPMSEGRGFVREVDGTFTRPFDFDTYPVAINADGQVAGYVGTATSRGLLSQPDGTEIFFDVVTSIVSAAPTAIDHAGRIAGWYYDPNTNCVCGFLRRRDGTFTTFAASDTASQTFPTAMNAHQIAGYFDDENGNHGFVRDNQNTDPR